MRISIIYRSIAIFFAVYLPMITVGVPLHKHYCQGELKQSQWIIDVESCHDAEMLSDEHECCGSNVSCHLVEDLLTESDNENDCCQDEMKLYKFDQSLILNRSLYVADKFLYQKPNLFFSYAIISSPLFTIINNYIPAHIHPLPNGQSRLKAFQRFLC